MAAPTRTDHSGALPMAKRRVSVKDAAPLLGVSVFMVRSLIRQRQLPHYKIGRRIVLDVADLERYLLEHRIEAHAR